MNDNKPLTPEQLKQIAQFFGLTVSSKITAVRDGVIKRGDRVWWHSEDGPHLIDSKGYGEWQHICNHRDCYSIGKPEFKLTYRYSE